MQISIRNIRKALLHRLRRNKRGHPASGEIILRLRTPSKPNHCEDTDDHHQRAVGAGLDR